MLEAGGDQPAATSGYAHGIPCEDWKVEVTGGNTEDGDSEEDRCGSTTSCEERQPAVFESLEDLTISDEESSMASTPKVNKHLDVQTTFFQGQKGELKVHISGVHNPSATWMCGNQKVMETDRIHTYSSSDGWCRLIFDYTIPKDCGRYKVFASYDINRFYSCTYVNVVPGPPVIKLISQGDIKANLGDNVFFSVSVYDNGKDYTVSWAHVDKSIIKKSTKKVRMTQKGDVHTLEIKNFQLEDTGKYKCVVTGSAGTSARKFNLFMENSDCEDGRVRIRHVSVSEILPTISENHVLEETPPMAHKDEDLDFEIVEAEAEADFGENISYSDYGSQGSICTMSTEDEITPITMSMPDLAPKKKFFRRVLSAFTSEKKASKKAASRYFDGHTTKSGARYSSYNDLQRDIPKPVSKKRRKDTKNCSFVVKDLRHEHIQIMERTLVNQTFSAYHWEKLCWRLNDKHVKIDKTDIELIKHPGIRIIGRNIIQNLRVKKPGFLVKDLCRIMKRRNRIDICELLKHCQNSKLADLSNTTLFDLEILLSLPSIDGEGRWEILAGDFDLGGDTVEAISQPSAEYKHHSSVEEMFNIIKTRSPKLTLSIIAQVLREIKCNDSADALEDIIIALKAKPPKRQTFTDSGTSNTHVVTKELESLV